MVNGKLRLYFEVRSKKVFGISQTTVDLMTGEVVDAKLTSTYVNRSSESFGMYTTTGGLEWAKPIRGYLLLLMVLNEYSDKDGEITLNGTRRNSLCAFMDWKNKHSLSTALQRLIELRAIKRISSNSYMINPTMMYKGSTNDKSIRINKYNSL